MDGIRFESEESWKARYDRLVTWGERNLGTSVKFKDESWFMRNIMRRILFFNKGFMLDYTTTIYRTIWFPTRAFVEARPEAAFKTLAHEFVHVDRGARGIPQWLWFSIRYLYPAILFVPLAVATLVLACVMPGLLWLFLPLLGIAITGSVLPWPSPGRVTEELYGYAMSVVCDFWCRGQPYEGRFGVQKYYIDEFYGSGYWFMYRGEEAALTARLVGIAERYEVDTPYLLGRVVKILAVYGPKEYDAALAAGMISRVK